MNAPFSVELCGLPGAGKSSLAPQLERGLRDVGVDVQLVPAGRPEASVMTRAAGKGRLVASQVVRTPQLLPIVGTTMLRDPQRRPRDRITRLAHWLATQARLQGAARGAQGVRLLDEGPVQALWSIGLWGDYEPLLERLERARLPLVLPDCLVVVRVDLEDARRRLTERPNPHSRIERTDASERLADLHRGAALLEQVVDLWEARRGRSAIEIDGGSDAVHAGGPGARYVDVATAIAASAEHEPDVVA